MSTPQSTTGGVITAQFAADTPVFSRVALNASGLMAVCGAATKAVGVAHADTGLIDVSEDAFGSVRLAEGGTLTMIAAKAIAVGARVYGAASGQVTDAAGGVFEGVALSAAANAGEWINVLPAAKFSGVVPFTHTITAGEATAGTLTIDSGLGVAVDVMAVLQPASGVQDWPGAVARLTGSDLGKITIAETPDTWTAGDRIVGYFIIGAAAL